MCLQRFFMVAQKGTRMAEKLRCSINMLETSIIHQSQLQSHVILCICLRTRTSLSDLNHSVSLAMTFLLDSKKSKVASELILLLKDVLDIGSMSNFGKYAMMPFCIDNFNQNQEYLMGRNETPIFLKDAADTPTIKNKANLQFRATP